MRPSTCGSRAVVLFLLLSIASLPLADAAVVTAAASAAASAPTATPNNKPERLDHPTMMNSSRMKSGSRSRGRSSNNGRSGVQLSVTGGCAAAMIVPALSSSSALRAGARWHGGEGGGGRLFTRGGFASARRWVGSGSRQAALPGRKSRAARERSSGAGTLRCLCAVPPLGISPVGWDLGMGTACLAASVVWVKLWTGLASRGKIKPQVSRKVVHATAAPLFMVLWPFFTPAPYARFFAAAVPLMQSARLTAAGLSGDAENEDASSNELVAGISRSGRASETLGGPLKYALVLTAFTALQWRSSVVGVVAILQLAVGDGMADLVGRRFGRHKWRKDSSNGSNGNNGKSVEGTVAFALSSFVASLGMIAWFHRFGVMAVSPSKAFAKVAGVSVACAAVELLPPRLVGDDNFSVPAAAVVVGRLLF